jgi:hypothetical protein
MPLIESEERRRIIARAMSDIRDACDAEANEQQDSAAKLYWRQANSEHEADLLGVDR